jgi:predicted RNA binding protein YcfA (HicA-like mRNA interferase family)
MAINYSHLRSLTAREVISALARDGFVLDRQAGSHQLYLQPDGRRVTVSFHRPGETFEIKTLRTMIVGGGEKGYHFGGEVVPCHESRSE